MKTQRTLLIALAVFTCVGASAQDEGVRNVTATDRSVIPLTTKLRYTTMILLPDGEDILDVVCGDRDYWVISTTANAAHVKPAKEGAATNLNLIAASGTVYSFLLSEQKATPPDLKVYVTLERTEPVPSRKYFSSDDVSALQADLIGAKASVEAAQRAADQTIDAFKQHYPFTLQFTYGPLKYERPFLVRSVWHDGRFTYIKTDARELPALYELKDGQASLTNFQVQHGTYVVPRVLDQAYLALGKRRYFIRQGR